MIGHLYRYPHPHDPTRFIYVGQGKNRDWFHRSGKAGFGLRFKRVFPSIELPQPIREIVEVQDQQELNDLETIHMFRYHTWCGYPDGQNITFPGSDYYKNGSANVITGHIQKLGKTWGRKNVESGQLDRIRNLPQSKAAVSKAGKITGPENIKFLKPFTLSKEHQSAAGRKGGQWAVEHKAGIHSFTLEQKQAFGRKSGAKAAATGQLEIARNSPQAKEARKKNGNSPETVARLKSMAAYASHCSWHVRRNIVKKGCKFCEVL